MRRRRRRRRRWRRTRRSKERWWRWMCNVHYRQTINQMSKQPFAARPNHEVPHLHSAPPQHQPQLQQHPARRRRGTELHVVQPHDERRQPARQLDPLARLQLEPDRYCSPCHRRPLNPVSGLTTP